MKRSFVNKFVAVVVSLLLLNPVTPGFIQMDSPQVNYLAPSTILPNAPAPAPVAPVPADPPVILPLPNEIHLLQEKIHIARNMLGATELGDDLDLSNLTKHYRIYRGDNWFESFAKGHRIFYVEMEKYLLEFRVVTARSKSLLEGDAAFQVPVLETSFSPSIELKIFEYGEREQERFQEIVGNVIEEEGFQDVSNADDKSRGSQYILLRNGSTITRDSIPEPLQMVDFREVRELGDNIRAFIQQNHLRRLEGQSIYFHETENNFALKMTFKNNRVISTPLYQVKSDRDRLLYAQFVYNVLAKIHNFTGRTPKIWDPVLMSLQAEVDQDELEKANKAFILTPNVDDPERFAQVIRETEYVHDLEKNIEQIREIIIPAKGREFWEHLYKSLVKLVNVKRESLERGSDFPLDLPQIVRLIHKKRKTIPPSDEEPKFIAPALKRTRKVAILHDATDPLASPLLARVKESPNMEVSLIIGKGKKGIAPSALWRNMNHGDYERLYKDAHFHDINDEDTGTYGYIWLNGRKIWVFKNLSQLKKLKEIEDLPAELNGLKIDVMLGANIDITVTKDEDDDGRRENIISPESDQLAEILGQSKGTIRTYSQMTLLARPVPNRTIVDPLFNTAKVQANDRHFKSPHPVQRLLGRLFTALRADADFEVGDIRSIRLDAQFDQGDPLDKSNRKGHQNASIAFSKTQETNFLNRVREYLNDLRPYQHTGVPSIDHALGKRLSDKTSSLLDVVLNLTSPQPLQDNDIRETLIDLAQGPLKGYLHIYDFPIMGQHVRKQSGIHISLEEGFKLTPLPSEKNKYKVVLRFWFDRDWEEAGELVRLADTVSIPGRQVIPMPEETELEAERDKIRDFLFERGTIPPGRRFFPHVEFAPEPAAGILQASTGRIGRVALYAITQNIQKEGSNGALPEYQVGNFNVRFLGVVGPKSIDDAVLPILADGTYGRWDADVEFSSLADTRDELYFQEDVNLENLWGWFTVNGSERIHLIRGRVGGTSTYLSHDEIPYEAVLPIVELSRNQLDHLFLFEASGTLLDNAGDAAKSGVIKRVLVPAPFKKTKSDAEAQKADDDPSKRRLFVYHLSDVRRMWKMGKLYSPGSCTTNCAIFIILINELLYNLPGIKRAGTEYLNQRIQRSIRDYFETFWDDFPEEWRRDPKKRVRFKLFDGGLAVTNHAVTNSQPRRNQEVKALVDLKPGDAKSMDNGGMNLTSSGVTKAAVWVLPGAKKLTTDSLRTQQDTGSNFVLTQSVAIKNARADINSKKLEEYLIRKVKEAAEYGARFLFQGSTRLVFPHDRQNAHSTRRDPSTSIFDMNRVRIVTEIDDDEDEPSVRFTAQTTAWYDNEWGFTSQVLGLLSELALAMGEEDRDKNGRDPIVWLPDSPEVGILGLGGTALGPVVKPTPAVDAAI